MSPVEAAFWARVYDTREGECWNWMGNLYQNYGRFTVQGRRYRAHAFSYELHHGPIPAGHVVRHRCDNPRCVNPEHLETGTHADNVKDRVSRRRSACGERQGLAKLTPVAVRVIRAFPHIPQRDMAAAFRVSQPLIGMVRRGEIWRHIT